MNDAVKEMKAAAENLADITPVDALMLTMWMETVLAEAVGPADEGTCREKIAVDFPISLGAAAMSALAASIKYADRPEASKLVTSLSDRIQKHLAEIEAGEEGNVIGFEFSRIQGAIIGLTMKDGLRKIVRRKIREGMPL